MYHMKLKNLLSGFCLAVASSVLGHILTLIQILAPSNCSSHSLLLLYLYPRLTRKGDSASVEKVSMLGAENTE